MIFLDCAMAINNKKLCSLGSVESAPNIRVRYGFYRV